MYYKCGHSYGTLTNDGFFIEHKWVAKNKELLKKRIEKNQGGSPLSIGELVYYRTDISTNCIEISDKEYLSRYYNDYNNCNNIN